jgi:hypothetical protein
MRKLPIIALLALAACAEPLTPAEQACAAARTWGEAYGTPERKGPCWGRTTAFSQMGNVRAYMVEKRAPGRVVATLTYEGSALVQVGEAAGW